MKRCYLLALALLLAVSPAVAQHASDTSAHSVQPPLLFLPPLGVISDFEHSLADDTIKILTTLVLDHEQKTTDQIAIATTADYYPYTDIADYARDLANSWKLGTKEKNNGILIVFSKQQRKVRISTGLGIEPILADAKCQQIVDSIMIPRFKQEKYGEGLIEAVKEIIKELGSLANEREPDLKKM